VVRRIVGRHWIVISLCLLAGIALPVAINRDQPANYTAEARLTLDVREPTSAEESTAIADSARALATSTKLVDAALQSAGVSRDAQEVATQRVALDALGTSGVLSLKVQDTNPATAARMATALAEEIIATRQGLGGSVEPQELNEIGAQLDDLNRQILDLQTRRNESSSSALDEQLAELTQQRNELEAQRSSLLIEELARPEATIIDMARPPMEADPSGMIPAVALGALLALIVGVGLAALLEILRPTIVGSTALARSLDSPVLGSLTSILERNSNPGTASSVVRVRLAARAAGVDRVELVDAAGDMDLRNLARSLSDAMTPTRGDATPDDALIALGADRPSSRVDRPEHDAMSLMDLPVRVLVRSFDAEEAATSGGSATTGLVVVAPNVLSYGRLEEVRNLLATVGWPLLGVITYRRRAFTSLLRRRRRSSKWR
jgi:capsular polysaccharide biosynthesis protein